MIPRRLVFLVLVAAVIAAGVASSASAALFFLFKPATSDAGAVVTVRLGGTPANFMLEQRAKPFRNGIRLYLVPSGVADEVSSRFDPRLHFIGRIVPDRNHRGVLSFRVPPLDSEDFALASWCPACAKNSFRSNLLRADGSEDLALPTLDGSTASNAFCDRDVSRLR